MSQKQNDEEGESSSEKNNVTKYVCQQMNVNVINNNFKVNSVNAAVS